MNNKKELEQVAREWLEKTGQAFWIGLEASEMDVANLVALLADREAAVLEDVRARIIAAHRMGDRDEWLDVAAWCRRKAEERQP